VVTTARANAVNVACMSLGGRKEQTRNSCQTGRIFLSLIGSGGGMHIFRDRKVRSVKTGYCAAVSKHLARKVIRGSVVLTWQVF